MFLHVTTVSFMSTPATRTTIEVNGFALREIRLRTGPGVADLADQIGVTRSYLAKIELGHSTRVSPKVFAALMVALDVKDRRALLANPLVQNEAVSA